MAPKPRPSSSSGVYPVIASQTGQFGQYEHLLTAGAFLQAAVPLAVFFLLQRFFVRGILAGSVKG